jgi:hypothetical protein
MTTDNLRIILTPGVLDEGPSYEKAVFGLLEIRAAGQMLTAAIDADEHGRHYANGPYISGYHLAEWLVWNWWRLRWEPRPSVDSVPPLDWDFSHRMSDIGAGYIWPNITISCDGFQCDLISERSDELDTPSFYYLGAPSVGISAGNFEDAADQFISFVLNRLRDGGVTKSNLQTLWNDLTVERNDPELARFRRIEALLGFDPDQTDEARIETWLKDADTLGENALDELATGGPNGMLSAQQIANATASVGFDMNAGDALRLNYPHGMEWGQTAAWRIGVAAANAVREQVGLAGRPVTDSLLADLAGTTVSVVTSDQCTNSLSWIFHPSQTSPRIALRQWRKTGRRFEVARLIGDRLFGEDALTTAEPLSPATRSYSYRQKAQRAFAAELLSPWETVRAMLDDDYSPENQEHVAEHFVVSPLTIRTLLVNNEGYSNSPYGESARA